MTNGTHCKCVTRVLASCRRRGTGSRDNTKQTVLIWARTQRTIYNVAPEVNATNLLIRRMVSDRMKLLLRIVMWNVVTDNCDEYG